MKKAKMILSLMLAVVMAFGISAAFAKVLEPDDDSYDHLAGATVNATVGEYNAEAKTLKVTLYDYDRYDDDKVAKLEAGDTILAGGQLYKIGEVKMLDGEKHFVCDEGEEIYFEKSYDGDDDLIARSIFDDRIFMHVVNELQLPVAEGIVLEDNSDPDLDAKPVITEGLENILKVKAEKEENSNGLNYYATKITLNENLEIVKIHQDFDVAQ